LDAVKSMRPVRYALKNGGQELIGAVAQEVEQYLPELVRRKSGTIDGTEVTDLRSIDLSALTYTLVNSVKELLARIEALEAKVP
jgi:Chaperone of endosialidase